MAFTPGQNYVARNAQGTYDVVINGVNHGPYATQQEAEQQYNTLMGQSNAPATPTDNGKTYNTPNGPKTLAQMRTELSTAGYNGPSDDASIIAAYNSTVSGAGATGGTPTGGANPAASAQKLLDAIASGNTQAAEEAAKEFQQDLAEKQREFDANQQAGQQKNYQDLATTLLNTAAQLQGPANYYQFDQYASGGRDLMNTLFGNQPRAAFSTPTGTNTPMTLSQLMQELGFKQVPQATTSTSSTAATTAPQAAVTADQINQMASGMKIDPTIIQDYVNQNHALPSLDQLSTFMQANGYSNPNGSLTGKKGPSVVGYTPQAATTSTPAAQPASPTGKMSVMGTTTPATPGMTTTSAAMEKMPTIPGYEKSPGTDWSNPQTESQEQAQEFATKLANTAPYQVNPAVWDSLSPDTQLFVQSALKSKGWDPNEWLKQLNAARPQGTAPRQNPMTYSAPAEGVY